MRPNTLADAVERIQAGSAQDVVLAEFVDTFDLAKTDQDRYASIEREPKLTGDARLDALVGAIAEYLAKQRRLGRVPHWVSDPARRLASPWFTTASPIGRHARISDLQQSRPNSRRATSSPRNGRCGGRVALNQPRRRASHDHRHRRTGRLRQGHARQAARQALRLSPPRYRRDLPRGRQGAAGCRAPI